jgi:hypothetical protein
VLNHPTVRPGQGTLASSAENSAQLGEELTDGDGYGTIESTMARLGKLERDVDELKGAVIQISAILVDQSERMDAGFRSLREEFRAEMNQMRSALTERLDRLIAVTIEERTLSASRLLDIERRVSKLEERIGPVAR